MLKANENFCRAPRGRSTECHLPRLRGPDGIVPPDQRRRHERVVYDRLLARPAGELAGIQPLLEPLVLDSKRRSPSADEHRERSRGLASNETLRGAFCSIRTVPAGLGARDVIEE